jgi:hypothetical protein
VNYTIHFERIGRFAHNVTEMFEAPNRDILTQMIHKYVESYLPYREYYVSIDFNKLRGTIEGGKYGTFTVKQETIQ